MKKTWRRKRTWLTTRAWITLITLVALGLGEAWMLARLWSDWGQHRYPVGTRPEAIVIAADNMPLP